MQNLNIFFINHFNTERISDNNIRKYAEDHLQRIIANNTGGIFNQLITDTTSAYNGYFGAITDEDSKTAIKEGSTISMNNALRQFKSDVSQKEGIIKGTYGVKSSVYQEFYPHGITEYTNATLGSAPLLMQRMITASTAHLADLGQPFVDLFTTHSNTFNTLRTSQLNLIGEVAGKKDASVSTRESIEIQLMKNMLFIAFNNVGNPEAVNTWFDQSIIRPDQSSATDGLGRAKGKITNASTGQPIPQAEVEAMGTDTAKVKSDDQGNYRTKNVTIGSHPFRFSKPGFADITIEKEIIDDGDTPLDAAMQPVRPPPPAA